MAGPLFSDVLISMVEAETLLNKRFDVIVCGTHFAESKMFDLLRMAKSMPKSQAVPLVCIRALNGELDGTAFQGISIATCALGAAGFVDLNRWRREYGFDQAREKLRQLVLSLAHRLSDDFGQPTHGLMAASVHQFLCLQ